MERPRHRRPGRRGRRRSAVRLRAPHSAGLPPSGPTGPGRGGGKGGRGRPTGGVGGATDAPPALRAMPPAASRRHFAGEAAS
eukprot:3551110-Pleurochrysis_carterae.AAC.1